MEEEITTNDSLEFSNEVAENTASDARNIYHNEENVVAHASQINSGTVVMVTTGNIGKVIVVPFHGTVMSEDQYGNISTGVDNFRADDQGENSVADESGEAITIATDYSGNFRDVITIPTEATTTVDSVITTGAMSPHNIETQGELGQVISIPTETIQYLSVKQELDPHLLSVLSHNGFEMQDNGGSPLSFVALVPGSNQYASSCTDNQSDVSGDISQSFVALVPDSTHHAPPISSQEEDNTLTLKEITARERSRLIKRAQRQNAAFRERERVKGRLNMKDKRKDPAYREMEKKKDRERRRLARLTNNSLREKERERDREYRRRVKIQNVETNPLADHESADSLECFMKDMDEKCQLLINSKADDSLNEETIYNYNDNEDFDDGILGSGVIGQNERSDLIGQYGDSVLHTEIISEKDSDSRNIVIKNVFESCSSDIT